MEATGVKPTPVNEFNGHPLLTPERPGCAISFPGPCDNQIEKEPAPKPAQDELLSERVRKLESQLKELKELHKQHSKNKESTKTIVAGKSIFDNKNEKKSKTTMRITGRVHFDSWMFPNTSEGIGFFENPVTGVDPANRVFFRRIRLEIRGNVLENMNYRAQVDFNDPSTAEIKDVYIGFEQVPFLQTVLTGNQKRPLGLDHLTSSRRTVFIERPLVVEAFNEDARRIGVASYTLSENEHWQFRMGTYMLQNVATTGEYLGDSGQWSYNARLSGVPWYDELNDGRNYFHCAVAGMIAHPDGDASVLDANRNEARFRTRSELRSNLRWLNTGRIAGAQWYEIFALESILNLGPFQVVAEYQNNWLQRDSVTKGTGPDLHFHGGYVYVAYFLTGEHMPYNRGASAFGRVVPKNPLTFRNRWNYEPKGWGALQVAFRYSYLDLSDADIRGGTEHNYTLGLVWYMNGYSSFQVNAIYGDIRDRDTLVGGFTSGHFTALGTRFRVEF